MGFFYISFYCYSVSYKSLLSRNHAGTYFLVSSVGAARTYRMLLHRINTSPSRPADTPPFISSAPSNWTLMYESVDTKFPRYSCPHLSFTATRWPTNDARNGFGLTMFNDISGGSETMMDDGWWMKMRGPATAPPHLNAIIFLIWAISTKIQEKEPTSTIFAERTCR